MKMSSWCHVMILLMLGWLKELCKFSLIIFPFTLFLFGVFFCFVLFLNRGDKKFQVLSKRFVLEIINKLRLEAMNKVAV